MHLGLASDPSSAIGKGTELCAFGPRLLHVKSQYHSVALGDVTTEHFGFICPDLSLIHRYRWGSNGHTLGL